MIFLILICLSLRINSVLLIRQSRILGGTHAQIKDFPYHASFRRMSDFRHICGGAIITDQHILTAGHCFREDILQTNTIMAYTGSADMWSIADGTLYDILKVYIHPEYFPIEGDITTFQHDIAVVKIDGIIAFNQYQNKVNLPVQDVLNGELGMLSGWGSTDYPSDYLSERLQKTWMTIIDNYRCSPYLPFNIYSSQFCAYHGLGVGPCLGDSGSPLVNVNTVIGIASFCRLCATGSPDIYTRVYAYLDFIGSIIDN